MVKKMSNCMFVFFVFIGNQMVAAQVISEEGINAHYIQHYTESDAGKVDNNVGSFSYKFPLTLPTGHNSITPEFALEYSSGNVQIDSLYGYGWIDSIPYIERSNRIGTDRLYETNQFVSALSGELIQKAGGAIYQPKVERGKFLSHEFVNNTWQVTDKIGTVYRYGETVNSQQSHPSNSSQIYRWKLSSITDIHGNTIIYTYTKLSGALYPLQISYGGIFQLDFTYQDRPDPSVSYITGFRVETLRRADKITFRSQGSRVWGVEFSYEAGEDGQRTLLTELKKEVLGGPVQTTSFSYSKNIDKSWEIEENWSVPFSFINGRGEYDLGVRLFDVNGDGLTDAVKSRTTTFNSQQLPNPDQDTEIWINTGAGFAPSSTWQLTMPDSQAGFSGGWDTRTRSSSNDGGARFTDVNGDGYTDIVWGLHGLVQINNQVDGWDHDPDWDFTLPHAQHSSGGFLSSKYKDLGARVLDINGDGLPDIIKVHRYLYNFKSYWVRQILTNTGSGWDNRTDDWDIPVALVDTNFLGGTRMVDYNGDSLPDIILAFGSNDEDHFLSRNKVYLNTGSGWEEDSALSVPEVMTYYAEPRVYPTAAQFVDINGDGSPNLYSNYTHQSGSQAYLFQGVYTNTSDGISVTINDDWNMHPDLFDRVVYHNNNLSVYDAGGRLVDLDGDGLVDILRAGPNPSAAQHTTQNQQKVGIHQGTIPDLLVSVINQYGGITTIDYQKTNEVRTDSNVVAGSGHQMEINVVRSVVHDDGRVVTTDTYKYKNASYYFDSNDIHDRRFAGFGSVIKTNDLGSETNYYHQGNGDDQFGELEDSEARIGQPFLREVSDTVGNIYKRTFQKYADVDVGYGTTYVKLVAEVIEDWDGIAAHRDRATAFVYDDENGNLLEKQELGEVFSNSDSTYTDTLNDSRTTVYTYGADVEGVTGYLASEELQALINYRTMT